LLIITFELVSCKYKWIHCNRFSVFKTTYDTRIEAESRGWEEYGEGRGFWKERKEKVRRTWRERNRERG